VLLRVAVPKHHHQRAAAKITTTTITIGQVLSPLEAPEHMSETCLMLRALDMYNGGSEVSC
jgi:hypothetical protein